MHAHTQTYARSTYTYTQQEFLGLKQICCVHVVLKYLSMCDIFGYMYLHGASVIYAEFG